MQHPCLHIRALPRLPPRFGCLVSLSPIPSCHDLQYERRGTEWTFHAYLKAANAEQDDQFAYVSLQDGTLAVGALREDSCASLTSATGAVDNGCVDSGAVYIFDALPVPPPLPPAPPSAPPLPLAPAFDAPLLVGTVSIGVVASELAALDISTAADSLGAALTSWGTDQLVAIDANSSAYPNAATNGSQSGETVSTFLTCMPAHASAKEISNFTSIDGWSRCKSWCLGIASPV